MMFSTAEWAALELSLKVSLCASLLSLPFAIAMAWFLARTDFWGKSIVSALVHLPLVLPPVVTGYGLLIVFGRQGTIGSFLEATFGLTLAFRWTGAALAAAIMGFPLMVRVIQLAIEALDPKLEEAAKTLGAGWGARFVFIVLPLIAPGILAGGILGFAKAMGAKWPIGYAENDLGAVDNASVWEFLTAGGYSGTRRHNSTFWPVWCR